MSAIQETLPIVVSAAFGRLLGLRFLQAIRTRVLASIVRHLTSPRAQIFFGLIFLLCRGRLARKIDDAISGSRN